MFIADCGFRDGSFLSGTERLVQFGPTLLVNIGLDPEYKYAESGSALNSDITQVEALVDTGAVLSCIDESLAQSLGLPLVDRQMILMLNGEHEANVYLAHIVIPALSFFQRGLFWGCSIAKGGRSHRAVIGRTLLRDMMLVYDGRTGSVRIIRQPSGLDAGKPLKFEEPTPQVETRRPLNTAPGASQPLPR